MTATTYKPFKFSGRIAPDDFFHQYTVASAADAAPDEHYIAPTTVTVTIVQPPNHPPIGVPQYGPTVYGGAADGFDPAGDCGGNYMSYKFQPNNNCYAYGCNITPNTFPQPGRWSGYLLTAQDFAQPLDQLGATVRGYAERDGLTYAGETIADLLALQPQLRGGAPELGGHFVALMVSPAGDANWPGDYHWARCDNSNGPCDSWSQKDGNDQVTNFDFAGKPISDPSTANWTVNQGPVQPGSPPPPDVGQDQVVSYGFYCFMYVREIHVNII
jgi:hypothetical protein